ncbi:MAG: hypothetical protein WA958_09770 [Tunicatimonas sp.]
METSTTDQLIDAAVLAIRPLLSNKNLQKRMSAYGFTPQRLQQGTALLNAVQLIGDTREENNREARHLTNQIAHDRLVAQTMFRTHAAIARTAFRETPLVLQDLNISKLVNGAWAWTKQALEFYKLAPTQMEQLQRFGAIPEEFQQNQAAVEALIDLRNERVQQKGKTQNLTQERNQKIRALREWYGEFRQLARLAFKEKPQLLETFGIVVPSGARKCKKTMQEQVY